MTEKGWGRRASVGRGHHPCRGQKKAGSCKGEGGGPEPEDFEPEERMRRGQMGMGTGGTMGAEPRGRAQSAEARTDCLKGGKGEERRRGGAGDGGRVWGSGPRGKEGQRLQDKGYRRGRGRVQDVRHGGDAAAPRSRGAVRGWGRGNAGAGGRIIAALPALT